ARANQKVVKSFFVGEGVKLMLTAVLISLLFLLTDFNPLWLMSGFVIAVISQWVAPILFLKST
ncbi:MAG: F0F1 ATP synthase subunit I, partial [Pseudomonadales bacterium]|nr:F0F1 ATP synthase subunit I [Pseudomonadales bacterium]